MVLRYTSRLVTTMHAGGRGYRCLGAGIGGGKGGERSGWDRERWLKGQRTGNEKIREAGIM